MEGTSTVPYKDLLGKEFYIIELEKMVKEKAKNEPAAILLDAILNGIGKDRNSALRNIDQYLTDKDYSFRIDGVMNNISLGNGKKIISLKPINL